MNKLTAVSAIAFAAAFTGQATAADLYSAKDGPSYGVATPVWTGFYLGINGGYGENASGRNVTANGVWVDENYGGSAHVLGPDSAGFLFGGQVGYLYQTGSFVIGAEFAFDGTNIAGDKASNTLASYSSTDGKTTGTFTIPTTMHQQLDWVGAGTLVLGVPFGNVLPYVKGGFAFGQVETSATGGGQGGIILNRTNTDSGYTVGAGIAYAFAANWRFGLEADYYDFGGRKLSASYVGDGPSGVTFTDKHPLHITTANISEDYWTLKAVLNYQTGSAYSPLK